MTTFKMPGTLGAPWSVEKIAAKQKTLRWRWASFREQHREAVLIGGVAIGCVGSFLCSTATPGTSLYDVKQIVGAALFLFVGLGSCLKFHVEKGTGIASLDPLDPSECKQMMVALRQVRHGEAFRQAVIGQGRPFTKKELYEARIQALDVKEIRARAAAQAARRGASDEAEHEACQDLYDLTKES